MKPHSLLAEYLQAVETALGALHEAYVEYYLEELFVTDPISVSQTLFVGVRSSPQPTRLFELPVAA